MWQADLTAQNESHISPKDLKHRILFTSCQETINSLRLCYERGDGKSDSEDVKKNFISHMKRLPRDISTITSELLSNVIDIILDLGELSTNKYSINLLATIINTKGFDFCLFEFRGSDLKGFLQLTFPIFMGSNPELRAPLMNLYLAIMKKQPVEILNYINDSLKIPEKLFEYFPIDNDDDPHNYKNRLIVAKFCKCLVQKQVTDAGDFIIENILQLINGVVVNARLKDQLTNLSMKKFYSNQRELKLIKTCLSTLIPMFNENPEIHTKFIGEQVLEELIYPLIHTEIADKTASFISEFLRTNAGSDNLPDLEETFTMTSVVCYILLYLLLKRVQGISIPTFPEKSKEEEEEEELTPEIGDPSLNKEREAAISLINSYTDYNTLFNTKIQYQIFQSNNTIIIDLVILLNTLIESYKEPFAHKLFDLFNVYHVFKYITNPDVVPVTLQAIIGNLFNNMITFFQDAPFDLSVIDFMASLLELEQSDVLPIVKFFIVIADHTAGEDKGILREHLNEYSEDVLDYITEGETDELREACLELASKLEWEIPS